MRTETESVKVKSVQRFDSRRGHKHILGVWVWEKFDVGGGSHEQGNVQEQTSIADDTDSQSQHPMESLEGANEEDKSNKRGNADEESGIVDDVKARSVHSAETQEGNPDVERRRHRQNVIIGIVGLLLALVAIVVPVICTRPGKCGQPPAPTPAPTPMPTPMPEWVQLGSILIGNETDYGYDVAISELGDVLAVGSPLHSPFMNGDGERPDGYGFVDIHKLDENKTWNRTARIYAPDGTVPLDPQKMPFFESLPHGMDFSYDLKGFDFGSKVSLSEDGTNIMIFSSNYRRELSLESELIEEIGYVEVNRADESSGKWNRYFWVPGMLPISSADMSRDGMYLAVCHRELHAASSYDMERFFEDPYSFVDDFAWPPDTSHDMATFGRLVAISGESETLVVVGVGYAYIYKFGPATWNFNAQQVPEDDSQYYPSFIEEVAVSKDGKRVAIYHGLSYLDPDTIVVWEEGRDGLWLKVGDLIQSPARSRFFSMSLSGNGETVAITRAETSPEGSPVGPTSLVMYRQNDAGDWEQEFDPPIHLPEGEWSSCALSYSGETVACGGHVDGDNGRVVAYRLES